MNNNVYETKKKIDRAEAHVQLSILGNFALRINDQFLLAPDSHVTKRRSILCYLILHRDRAVSHTELLETFYEDETQSNPAAALKMQIGRIRKLLSTMIGDETPAIISNRGSYQWNPAITCWVDIETFENLCHDAEQETTSDDDRISLYKRALELYAGDPILEGDNLLWSKALSSRCHIRYVTAMERYAELLNKKAFYTEAEVVCLKAIEKDSTNENLYALLIRALLEQKKIAEAKVYYDNIVDTLQRSLGIHPSAELQQLYSQTLEVKKPWEQDLSLVMKEMRNTPEKQEAFFCAFEQFKNIYQLEVRRANRDGGCLHIAMLTVLGFNGKILSPEVSDVIMEQVQQSIVQNLRQSDVVAQYSACQFIIMLPYANYEDSQMVVERIKNAYHENNPKSVIRFSYQLHEIETM